MHKVDRSGSDEEYYDARSDESGSDLESIPTTSDFKQHTWKGNQPEKVTPHESQKVSVVGKVFSQDKKQHIKEKLEDGKLVYSGEFSYNDIDIKVHNKGSLL